MDLSQADKQVLTHFFGEEKVNLLSGALKPEDGELSLGLTTNGKKLMSIEDIQKQTRANEDAYIEIGYKKVAKALGLDLEPGEKDPSIIAEKLKTELESSLEDKYRNQTPTEELEKVLQAKLDAENKAAALLKTLEEKETSIEEWNNKYSTLQNEVTTNTINSEIRKYLKNPEKAGLTYEQQLALFKLENPIKTDENGFYPTDKDGNPLLNSVGEKETIENSVKLWLDKQSFTKSRSGMGGGDRTGVNGIPKGMTDDQAMEYLKNKNIEPMSDEGLNMFSELTAKA